jgi:hypothetical protein
MLAQEKPGLGIEVDEKIAAKFPFPPGPPNLDYSWGQHGGVMARSSDPDTFAASFGIDAG